MAYTFEELKHKKVNELRDIAKEMDHEEVQGYTQLNKEHLLEAICHALNLDMHVHHEVVGVNKGELKSQIKELKKKRDEAISEKKPDELKQIRRKIRNLKKSLRKAAV
jgi:L-fucose mutarotase/ribose pyranase (RbsD/FucU family)